MSHPLAVSNNSHLLSFIIPGVTEQQWTLLADQSHSADNRKAQSLDTLLHSSPELLLPLSEKVRKFCLEKERKFYIKENISQKYKCGLI